MYVYEAQPRRGQLFSVDKSKKLRLRRHPRLEQPSQSIDSFVPSRQSADGEFAGHKRMTKHLFRFDQALELVVAASEVVDPDGCVDENQSTGLSRCGIFRSGIVPPSWARRLPASRAMSAFNPSRISCSRSLSPR